MCEYVHLIRLYRLQLRQIICQHQVMSMMYPHGSVDLRMWQTPAIRETLSAPPLTPLENMTDDEIVNDFRQRCGTVFHPCCTARMGPDPKTLSSTAG